MKKILLNIICSFIPSKVRRHRVRAKFLNTSNASVATAPIATSVSNQKSVTPYLSKGSNNQLLILDKETNSYVPCHKEIPGLDVRFYGNNNVIKIDEPGIVRKLHIHCHGHSHRVHIGAITDRSYPSHIMDAWFLLFYNNCELEIGENFAAAGDLCISLGEPYARCRIGNNVRVAEGVRIFASDAHPLVDVQTGKVLNWGAGKRCLTIGDSCWIGMRAILLKNTDLPVSTTVSAMSLVTKKFSEPNIVVAGVPAKVIMSNVKRLDKWTQVDLPPVKASD